METTSPGRDTPDSLLNRIRTGLTQSSASLSSTGPNYSYGNQQGYDTGSHGYPLYYGYLNDDAPQRLELAQNNNNKPKITSAVYKNRGNSKGSIEVLVDGPLSSDAYAREGNDPIQEEQIRLGNSSYFTRIPSSSPKFSKLASMDGNTLPRIDSVDADGETGVKVDTNGLKKS